MYFSTHFFSRQVLNAFQNQSTNGYGQLFCGLFLTDPTNTGQAGAEVVYEGYQRQPISFTPPADFNGHLSISNTQDITWPMSSQSPGSVRYIGIFDRQQPGDPQGNMLLRGELTVPLEIRPNQQPGILAGDIIYWSRGNFSRQFRTAYLNLLRGQSLTGFTTHAAMFDGNPESGGGELSGENYSRPAITFTAPHVVNGVMTITNTNTVTFPTPLDRWGMWRYRGFMQAATGAAIAAFDSSPNPEEIHRGYIGRFAERSIIISHD
ncbi:MAG: hypothetical protein FWC91_01945 [Defluviitaleaceae bacterium]|nr:hypothetical protein [Defluviitaleaceae bacterium]